MFINVQYTLQNYKSECIKIFIFHNLIIKYISCWLLLLFPCCFVHCTKKYVLLQLIFLYKSAHQYRPYSHDTHETFSFDEKSLMECFS